MVQAKTREHIIDLQVKYLSVEVLTPRCLEKDLNITKGFIVRICLPSASTGHLPRDEIA